MNYGKLTAGTTKTAIDTAKPSEKGEIITYLSRMGDVLKYVVERHHLRACFLEGIYIFLNGNEPDAEGRVFDFKIVAHIKIIPAKTTEILYDDGIYQALFHQVLHLDETRSVEGRPRKSVIREKLRVRKIIPLCVCK